MITTLPPSTAVHPASPAPIRHLDGLESPAPGMWPLVVSSSVQRSLARTPSEALTISGGWLDVGAAPATSWMHVQLADRVIDLTVDEITAHPFEPAAWHLSGVARFTDHARQQPVTMTLRYHGVHRRGGQTWAWFSGTAVVGVARSRRRPAERLTLDLLFEFDQAGGR